MEKRHRKKGANEVLSLSPVAKAFAIKRVAELKAALDDMRAQRDAWQAIAQARIRPAPASAKSRWSWLRLDN
jgi:hypothetical protein